MNRKIITAETIRAAARDGETAIIVGQGDIVTQQAEDDARRQGIALTSAEDFARRKAEETRKAEEIRKAEEVARQTEKDVAENCAPSSQEGGAVGSSSGLTPEQMVTSVVSQLQQALAPLTQALPKLLAGAPFPAVNYTPGRNPMAATPVSVQPDTPVMMSPASSGMSGTSTSSGTSAPSGTDETLVAEVRRRVLAALPQTPDVRFLDELIRTAMAVYPDEIPELGGNVTSSSVMSAPGQNTDPSGTGIDQVKGIMRVKSKAQQWGRSVSADSVTMMDVLTPEQGAVAHVGYLEWENQSIDWTFVRPEVLVVLEGELKMLIEGTSLPVQAGDVCSIPAGSVMRLEATGHVKCTTISGMCA